MTNRNTTPTPLPQTAPGTAAVISADSLDDLIQTLRRQRYDVIGPTVADDAIVLAPISGADALPLGWVEDQQPGRYRLKRAKKAGYFDFTHGAQTWKRYLFPPKERLWTATRSKASFTIEHDAETPKQAFIGVRACELNAIRIQDAVFADGDYNAHTYQARRDKAFIVALNCRRAGGTCFCASMNAGPKVDAGFDLALTELSGKSRHDFLVECGSDAGAKVLAKLDARPATAKDLKAAKRAIAQAEDNMGRKMPKSAAKALGANLDSPRWADIAERCLSCANCTMVCPTCFCNTVTDTTSLDGQNAERWRQWDSCFTFDFSYIHGGAVRPEPAQRYRQWITHKLAHWHEQFGTSGCVGCGRCISWCPVGIDITVEARAIAKRKGRT